MGSQDLKKNVISLSIFEKEGSLCLLLMMMMMLIG